MVDLLNKEIHTDLAREQAIKDVEIVDKNFKKYFPNIEEIVRNIGE